MDYWPMNPNTVGRATIEIKSKARHKLAEIFANVFVLNFIGLLFIFAIFGG